METIKKLVKEIDQQAKELERMSEDLHKPFAGAFEDDRAYDTWRDSFTKEEWDAERNHA